MRKITKRELISFEDKVKEAFERGEINCPVHLCGGNEDELINIFDDVKDEDYVFSTHRNHYHYLLKSGDTQGLFDEIQGKSSGVCGGNGRSMHIYSGKYKFFTSAIVGGIIPIAVGTALAIKRKGNKERVWCFIGDGATDAGIYFSSVRYAFSFNLPITFVIEDNDYSVDTKIVDRWNFAASPTVIGEGSMFTRTVIYRYNRIYPHVGTGKWVTF